MKATIDRQLWLNNLLEVAEQIADGNRQETGWIAADKLPWEKPEELINVLLDDCVFELFIDQHCASMTTAQKAAAESLCRDINQFSNATPHHLVLEELLADPRWFQIREDAAEFIRQFA